MTPNSHMLSLTNIGPNSIHKSVKTIFTTLVNNFSRESFKWPKDITKFDKNLRNHSPKEFLISFIY